MKNLIIVVVFLFAILLFSCAKPDTGSVQQEAKTTTPAAQTDSLQIDSAASDLQKSTKDLKNEADDVQKAVDDLLK